MKEVSCGSQVPSGQSESNKEWRFYPELFPVLIIEGLKPDYVTDISLISCDHVKGLVSYIDI